MHEVVVIAVRNAVSAATITFTATSMIFFFISVFCVKFLNAEVPKSLYRGPCLLKGVCEILYRSFDSAGIPRPFRGGTLSVLLPAPVRGGVRGGVNQ